MDIFFANNSLVHEVEIPASKSFAQRAIIAATLCKEQIKINNIGTSNDVHHILEVANQLGALVEKGKNTVLITGNSHPFQSGINVGESGLGIRLTVAIAAVLPSNFSLSGEGSLLKRSMVDFKEYLPQLGVEYSLNNGCLPIEIKGNAQCGNLEINGNLSSQYLSGLLMALPLLDCDSTIKVIGLNSKPYIDITLDVLKAFNIEITHENYTFFKIKGKQVYQRNEVYIVEGDYSGAAMWMVAGALGNGIKLKGLKQDSVQGDRQMLMALEKVNIAYRWSCSDSKEIGLEIEGCVTASTTIRAFDLDATDCPDLFPALVVLAAGANGISTIKGVKRLFNKESNRAVVLQNEFGKLGLKIELDKDLMFIHGTGKLNSGIIDSHNDHRIAMAGAIAARLTDKGITVQGAESVNKSYPDFFTDLLDTSSF